MVLIFSVLLGAIIVTFNIKVLGGKISYFQSVSILGYCICPIFVALIIAALLKFLQFNNQILRLILIVVGAVWSIFGKILFYFSCKKLYWSEFARREKVCRALSDNSILLVFGDSYDL